MSRVLVCGGRLYSDWWALSQALEHLSPACVITGGASGADNMAERWAGERPTKPFAKEAVAEFVGSIHRDWARERREAGL